MRHVHEYIHIICMYIISYLLRYNETWIRLWTKSLSTFRRFRFRSEDRHNNYYNQYISYDTIYYISVSRFWRTRFTDKSASVYLALWTNSIEMDNPPLTEYIELSFFFFKYDSNYYPNFSDIFKTFVKIDQVNFESIRYKYNEIIAFCYTHLNNKI